ncbi:MULTISPECIES: alpha/beta fold hydrolase [unclassified Pseudomonas]|jgi:pimeloyl-ACP methyl ester carboxylesterase|uniref:alpha/beta fold hydrolase n=1 Tax=unclassified Pseudomonas TaxID=196821 RepID=UPI0015A0CC51|nr:MULTISPECIES: alpha/beta hydrolase [unclassified Pseudomonas]NWA33450.1 alpha/beta hydrolase [Pseudomonas sp. C6002]NWB64173.1 alpha/beta hydrolase [Pseudomonas sp. F1002]
MLKSTVKTLLLPTLMAAAMLTGQAYAATPAPSDTTVVLVHGAFADGSSWNKVIPLLQAKGLKVVAVQNPLTSLADDVAAAQRVIDAQSGRVVLVGHSWAGSVITQGGTSDKVKALVYVAAFAPSEGQSSAESEKGYPTPPGIETISADASGYLYLPAASVAKNFAQDLPADQANLIAVTQGPILGKAFDDKITVAAWKTKPNYYIVAAKDRMIDPGLEQAYAKKINATTTVVQTSHVPMLSQPQKVADVIIAAASKR